RGQKLKPSASAPASTAALASSSVRTPQILTLTRLTFRLTNQPAQRRAGISRAHKRFADQERQVASRAQSPYVFALRNPALAHQYRARRRERREVKRSPQINVE